jgi:hypothetical protein
VIRNDAPSIRAVCHLAIQIDAYEFSPKRRSVSDLKGPLCEKRLRSNYSAACWIFWPVFLIPVPTS